MWRRYAALPLPSHHAIRSTCIQILPLVEMFCKWELEEDCSDLRALMRRFDSESDLETHELGRSLLCMLHDDDMGMHNLPLPVPIPSPANPFDLVRERLAAAGTAIRGLQHQVGKPSNIFSHFLPADNMDVNPNNNMWFACAGCHVQVGIRFNSELYCLARSFTTGLWLSFTGFTILFPALKIAHSMPTCTACHLQLAPKICPYCAFI